MNYLKKDRYSAYVVGALIGVLSWVSFYFMHQQIGTTMTIQKIVGIFIGLFSENHILESNYYMSYFKDGIFSWQMAFVTSIFFGSLLASKFSNSKRKEHVPAIWEKNFGSKKWVRYIGAFIGGFLIIFGARFAGGCTSGHAISGGLQLAVSGWTFMASVFAFAIGTSLLIYRKS